MDSGNLNFVRPSPLGVVPLREVALCLHPQDNVAIAKISLQAGTTLAVDDQDPPKAQVPVRQFIPSGHKVALREMPPGEPVRRYGQVIGFASQTISPGEHVHTQNVGVQDFAREHTFGVDVRPVTFVPESDRRTFLGYRRTDGRVGARNYIAVISIVNCSAHTSREIARYFTSERLGAFPNVDGVLAFTHQSGCPLGIGSPDYVPPQRTLAAYSPSASSLDARFDNFSLYPASCGPSAASAGFEMGTPEIHQAPLPPGLGRVP